MGTTGEVVGGIGVGSAEDSNDNKTKLYLKSLVSSGTSVKM